MTTKTGNKDGDRPEQPVTGWDIAAGLVAAFLTGLLAVMTGFISSHNSLAAEIGPFSAVGPLSGAGSLTGVWLKRKLLRSRIWPGRDPSRLGFLASTMVFAGTMTWFIGMVKLLSYYRPYLRDKNLGTWWPLLIWAGTGTVFIIAGRILDRRLRRRSPQRPGKPS